MLPPDVTALPCRALPFVALPFHASRCFDLACLAVRCLSFTSTASDGLALLCIAARRGHLDHFGEHVVFINHYYLKHDIGIPNEFGNISFNLNSKCSFLLSLLAWPCVAFRCIAVPCIALLCLDLPCLALDCTGSDGLASLCIAVRRGHLDRISDHVVVITHYS